MPVSPRHHPVCSNEKQPLAWTGQHSPLRSSARGREVGPGGESSEEAIGLDGRSATGAGAAARGGLRR